MKETDKSNNVVKPIVFVNNPIKSTDYDVIGFSNQVEMISCAIDEGNASMIGVIADYGTGKSSMTEMLKDKYFKEGNPNPIKINMWDSLSESHKPKSNDEVSDLTKSFLFQLANGYDSKLGSYINKLLSKNYGIISFASNHFKRLFWCFLASAICFVLYKISRVTGTGIMQYLPDWGSIACSCFRVLSPVFILISAVFAVLGIKDISVAFSHWKMTNSKSPEINDIFDIYRIVADEICPAKNKKQLVFIDDLDRINDKTVVISFLKELYRFQDSICAEKSKFVFIVSVMPESHLLKGTQGEKESNNVFSKIFDTTVYLKPIHFDDYDSILLQLIKGDNDKKQALEKLIGEHIDDHLPDAFKWIKRGSNLTLRDLKERLNQAIAIMVSLVNKSYVGNSAADFQACTAVAYFESAFPDDYYRLIKNEVNFAEFIKESLPIINRSDKNADEGLMQVFNTTFEGEPFSEKFKSELCMLILAGIIDDDFRMYFYTYPKGSHIKTTAEREICDYILFPNQRNDYSGLSDAVNQAFENGSNPTVEQEISARSSFPRVLLENDTLFTVSAQISPEKLFYAFKRYCIEKIDSENKDIDIWKRVLLLTGVRRQYFIDSLCSALIELDTDDNSFLKFRKKLILAFGDEILSCSNVFVGDNVPIITSEEVGDIDNQLISIQLINTNKLSVETYDYISKLLLAFPLIENNKNVFDKALGIWGLYSEIVGERVSNDALAFLRQNHYLDDKTFGFIYQNIEDKSLTDYINEFTSTELSDVYLSCLDQKCVSDGLSDELLSIMIDKKLLITPLSHYANQDKLEYIDIFEPSAELVINSCEVIHEKYPNLIIRIRTEAYLIKNISAYLDLYRSPYPLMTENEYVNEEHTEKAISLIDIDRIDGNNFEQVRTVQLRSYNRDELMLLLLTLFGANNYGGGLDCNIKSELVDTLDFAKLGFKQLDFSQRNEIFSFISDVLPLSDDEAIRFLKSINCFIPSLEERITDNEEYPELIKQFDELTNISTEWLDKNYITCDLSEKLCDQLYASKDYINYIIASALRVGALNIDDTISFENYADVYKKSDELFNIMSADLDFLERFQQEAIFSEFDMDHIKPAYKAKQHERFFNYIDTLVPEEKKIYYMSFGKFFSLNDSKLFRKLVCREDNMELLGDYKIYNHIKEQLWEDDPYDKGQFTKVWNKRWKSELGEKRSVEMD